MARVATSVHVAHLYVSCGRSCYQLTAVLSRPLVSSATCRSSAVRLLMLRGRCDQLTEGRAAGCQLVNLAKAHFLVGQLSQAIPIAYSSALPPAAGLRRPG